MWLRQLAKNIELGPRQYDLFVSEAELRAEQNQLMANVACQVERQGEVALGEMVRIAARGLNWSEAKVLQQLFWLSQELAIQFRRHSRAISAAAALTQLLTSAAPDIVIGLNRHVDDGVFRLCWRFCGRSTGRPTAKRRSTRRNWRAG